MAIFVLLIFSMFACHVGIHHVSEYAAVFFCVVWTIFPFLCSFYESAVYYTDLEVVSNYAPPYLVENDTEN